MSQIEIFYSYSHKDEQYREELEKQLSLLKWQGVIANWTDRRILAGQEWAGEISKHLDTAQIILLLISPDFMASPYCYSIEMQRAIERHERGEAHVIPVILRSVHWQDAPFGKLQALPTDAKPVKSWSDQDEAFFSVAAGIRNVVKELEAKHPEVSAKTAEQPVISPISPLPPSPQPFPQPEKIEIAPPIELPLTQNTKTFELKHVLTVHSNYVRCVAISPDGQILVSGSDDKTIRVWDSHSGELLRVLKGHTGWFIFASGVLSIAVSADGQTIVSGSADKTVRVGNLLSGELLRTLTGHKDWVRSVAISPDGQTIVSGSDDNTIKVWNLHSGKLFRTLTGHNNYVWSVAISPDGQTVVSGSSDKTVRVWNLLSGELLRTLIGHEDWVRSVAISPDGRTIVSGSDDNTIKVWKLHSGALLRTLVGHESWVSSVAISPDGQAIVSGSGDSDKTIKVWSLISGELLRTLTGHKGSVWSVAVSPDGRTIVSGSADTTIRVWGM